MFLRKENRAIGIGIMLVLTTFVSMAANVSAQNEPPVAKAGGPYISYECHEILLNASGSYDPEGAPLTYRWYINGTWIDNHNYPLLNWIWLDDYNDSVTLEVSNGVLNATDTAWVTILNVPPVITNVSGPTDIAFGTEADFFVQFYDGFLDPLRGLMASLDTYIANFSWGDDSWDVYPLGVTEFNISDSHMYDAPGIYHIIISITDDNGGIATWDEYLNVEGTLPQVEAGPNATIDEGMTFQSNGYFIKTEDGMYTATVNYGDGSGSQPLSLNADYTFNLSHQYLDNGLYTVDVAILKDGTSYVSDSAFVTVVNVPPTIISLSGPVDPVLLGVPIDLLGAFIDPGILDGHVANISWGDGLSTTMDLPAGEYQVNGSHTYESAGVYTIILTVTDDDGGSDSKSIEVTMMEAEVFTVDAGPDGVIDEGSLFVSAGSFVSSVGGVFTGMVDYGDGSGSQPLALNPDYTFGLSHQYVKNGVYTIVVTIFKEGGTNASDSALVTVNNVPPIATLMNNGPKDEGSPVMIAFTNQYDPGVLDTFSYSFDWNNDGVYEISNQASASMSHTWYDEGMYTVKGKIQDDDGGFTEYITVVTVMNVPPTITSLSGPVDPVLLGNPISFSGVFTDPGTLDGHVALINWGDGKTTTVDLPAGIYQLSKSHIYGNVGVYTIMLTVTDDDGGFDTKSIDSYIVIYNPNCGFITGGGWLISPPGSYPANPTLSGRVNFGFVSKYLKGQVVPEGNTEFQFQQANINFHSEVYEWLIIAGAKATYLGEGTINGQGHYGFRLTAIDGKISGGGGVDKLRMKIWDKDNNDQIVYDTNYGTPDTQDPSVALSGGQITIHKA